MDTLVGADGKTCSGRDGGHPGQVVSAHRLLEESEARIRHRADILNGLVSRKALVCVGRDHHIAAENGADAAGALGVDQWPVDADLDLERAKALRGLALGV